MKMVSTFEITKGFDRWLQLVDVELKSKLEEYGVKVHSLVQMKMRLVSMICLQLKTQVVLKLS